MCADVTCVAYATVYLCYVCGFLNAKAPLALETISLIELRAVMLLGCHAWLEPERISWHLPLIFGINFRA